jgi:hypothetical protein
MGRSTCTVVARRLASGSPSSQAALDSARSGKDSERPGVAVAVSKTRTVVDGPS